MHNEYRKLGIGSKLFEEFKKICKENKINEIKVVASYNNLNAIEFYKRNGFKEAELTLKQNIDSNIRKVNSMEDKKEKLPSTKIQWLISI